MLILIISIDMFNLIGTIAIQTIDGTYENVNLSDYGTYLKEVFFSNFKGKAAINYAFVDLHSRTRCSLQVPYYHIVIGG